MITAESRREFIELCDSAESFVLVTHMHPDGDALGSQVALAGFLLARGKQVRIINNDPTSEVLRFVSEPVIEVQVYRQSRDDASIAAADLIVLVDNSVPDRLGRMERVVVDAAERTLCIDHHAVRDAPWKYSVVDVSSSATTAMIYELVSACGWHPDLRTAIAIYVGLVTDTGYFRYNSTDDRTHAIAAELLRLGVDSARIYREIYERNSEAFTRLQGHCLAGLRLDSDGAVASVKITRQLVETLQAEDVDTSEIATSLLAMDHVRIAALFKELPDGRVKVSLRSKGELDVHKLACEFGGGGHRNASGLVICGGLDQAVAKVTERATTMVEGQGSLCE